MSFANPFPNLRLLQPKVSWMEFLRRHKVAVAAAMAAGAYAAHYLSRTLFSLFPFSQTDGVCHPQASYYRASSRADVTFTQKIVGEMKLLKEDYWPTFWFSSFPL